MTLKKILQGRFMAHPLHPALVHLPIGFWIGSLIFDAISATQGDPAAGNFFVNAGWWCMLLGCVLALPAAITGLAEFIDVPANTRVQRVALTHMTLNILVLGSYIVQLFIRDRALGFVPASLLTINLVTVVVLGISGYLGGKMVFEYGVGSHTPINPQIPPRVETPTPPRRVA
jgi:uncharacterized membrane protein